LQAALATVKQPDKPPSIESLPRDGDDGSGQRLAAGNSQKAPPNPNSAPLDESRRMTRLKQVWQFRKVFTIPPGAPRLNCLAALISAMALGILALTFHATPAGAGLDNSALAAPQLQLSTPVAATNSGAGQDALAALSSDELNRRIHSAIHTSRLALQLHIALLEAGKHRLAEYPDYTATFLKQERVDGDDLQELQTIELKMRHKPFSVYMKWLEGGDVGRQALFVEGQYDDKLQVKLGGKKGTILPVVKLDPTGSMAMKESRYPVTEMGILQLIELILKYRYRDLALKQGVRWEIVPDQQFLDRPCDCLVIEYASRDIDPVYRRAITYLDKQSFLPICVKNFGWPAEGVDVNDAKALDEATLIEYYGYTDIQLEHRLSDADFDKANADYKFRR
jgi:hypothetical protein